MPSSGFFYVTIGQIDSKSSPAAWRDQLNNEDSRSLINGLLPPATTSPTGPIYFPGAALTPFSFSGSSFGNSWYLDGSLTPISFAGLPAGFKLITQVVATANIVANLGSQPVNAHIFWGSDVTPNVNLINGVQTGLTFDILTNHPNVTPVDLEATNFGVVSGDDIATSGSTIQLYGLYIFGVYEIIDSYFTLENPSTPVYIGDKVKITGTPDKSLDDIKQAQLTGTDPTTGNSIKIIINNFILQQSDQLWFYLPLDLGTFTGPLVVSLIGNGVQFSGSVSVGILTVLYEDASGIYQLVDGQTDDIIYFRAGHITDTIVIMLPDMLDDNLYEDDFFNLLQYPYKILAQDDLDEDELGNFNFLTNLRTIVILLSVEIPSPFIRTAFLP